MAVRLFPVFTCSIRAQVADSGRKLTGASHFNKDGAVNGSRCYKVAWVPGKEEQFISAHADGNLFVYDKVRAFLWLEWKEGCGMLWTILICEKC